MDSELRKRKSSEDQNDSEHKIRCFIAKMDKAQRQLDEILSKKTRIDTIDKELVEIDELMVLTRRFIQRMQKKISTVQEMYSRRARNLKRQRVSLLAQPVEVTVAATQSPPPRADLKSVYHSKAECTVCTMEHDGKDIVYMDNCTHVFCKSCVTRAKPQYRCMECRESVSVFYTIVKCGERYKLKSYKVYYNFIEDRPMRPTEYSATEDDTRQRNYSQQLGNNLHLRRVRNTVIQHPQNFRHANNDITITRLDNASLTTTSSSESPDMTRPNTRNTEQRVSRPPWLSPPLAALVIEDSDETD